LVAAKYSLAEPIPFMKPLSPITYGSFYSGCGGASEGAKQAGLRSLFAVDYDSEMLAIHAKNHGGHHIHKDVYDMDNDFVEYLAGLVREVDNIFVLQLSPSCKEYSGANHSRDPESKDGRSVQCLVPAIEKILPEYVVLENVPGYMKSKAYAQLLEVLVSLRYKVTTAIVNASDYGIPQDRRRLIVVASANGMPVVMGKHIRSSAIHVGWYEAVSHLVPGLAPADLTPNQSAAIAKSGVGLSDYPLLVSRIGYGKSGPLVRARNDYAPTLKSSFTTDGKGGKRNKYWTIVTKDQAYNVSTAVAALLMGFPADYAWTGDVALDIRGAGNAVPPGIVKHICESIKALCGGGAPLVAMAR
jgi:DNA (cytosine-5)-methyltransferase 1